jgi:hypothetical protein
MFWQAMTSGMFWKTVILARMDSCFRLMKGRHHDAPPLYLYFTIKLCGRYLAHLAERPCEILPSLGIRRLLTFHILIYSSETA